MITSLTWVPRGAAQSRPARFELSAAECERIKELAKEEVEGENEVNPDVAIEIEDDKLDSDLPPEFEMDKYDEDDEIYEDVDNEDEEHKTGFAMVEHGGTALAVERKLYIDEDLEEEVFGEDDDEDMEDNEIRPTDSLLVVALTEDDHSHLEVQLLTDDGTLFVHHDITLPDFPLCLAWMDCPPFLSDNTQMAIGNYIAVGTFSPPIEIWNLDVLDPLEPTAVLGGTEEGKKGKKKEKFKEGSHTEAVMSLSWNREFRQALASGSADHTVKVWDVTTQTCSHTFGHHSDKVQSVTWHPNEAWLLATGAFDRSVSLIDCRSAATTTAAKALSADIEKLQWDPYHNPYHLYCALEDGMVVCLDVRKCSDQGVNEKGSGKKKKKNSAKVFSFQAHDQTVSGLSFSSSIPGMLSTASIDKTVRVWDVAAIDEQQNEPKLVAYKTMNVGKLFAVEHSPDEGYVLATGGDKGMLAVWESDELAAIEAYFSTRPRVTPKVRYDGLKNSQTVEPVNLIAGASFGAGSVQKESEEMQGSGEVQPMEVEEVEVGLEEMEKSEGMNSAGKKKKKKKKTGKKSST